MIIISAMSRDHVIGSGEGMPWDVPEEYEHFRETTRDQTIIIGRRSYEIFGSTLTAAQTIVVTRSTDSLPDAHAMTVPDFDSAVHEAGRFDSEVFVAGGASIYDLAINVADRMYLSYIKGEFEGDAWFPEFRPDDWTITRQEDRGRYEYVEYLRRPAE